MGKDTKFYLIRRICSMKKKYPVRQLDRVFQNGLYFQRYTGSSKWGNAGGNAGGDAGGDAEG